MAGKWCPVQGRDNKYFTVDKDMCVSKWSGLRQNMVEYEIVMIYFSPFLEGNTGKVRW